MKPRTNRVVVIVILLLAGLVLGGIRGLVGHVLAVGTVHVLTIGSVHVILLPLPVREWRIEREQVRSYSRGEPDFDSLTVGPLVVTVPTRSTRRGTGR